MEGYKPKKKLHNVTYVQYPGLLISSKGTTIGRLQEMAKMKMTVNEQDAEKVDKTFAFFTGRVVTWNLLHPEVETEDEGNIDPACPECGMHEGDLLPTTKEALYCLELSFVLSLIFGWMAAIASVSDPKEQSYNDGGMSTHMANAMSQLAELQSPLP